MRVHGQRGSAVVEFALVVPLLLLVAAGLVQIAVLGRDELVLTQAARSGAREAAVESDDAAVVATAKDAAVGLEPSLLEVSVERAGGLGAPVAVAVTYEARVALPLAGWLLPSSVHLRAAATMRQEFG